MRFVTFSGPGSNSGGSDSGASNGGGSAAPRAGILRGDGAGAGDRVIDLAHPAFAAALGGAAPDVLSMVQAGLGDITTRLMAVTVPEEALLRLSDVTLHAPLTRPGRIFGVAHNYRAALAERGMPLPDAPVLFDKRADTIVGPGAAVMLAPDVGGCTYEAELAVVIGRPARGVAEADALGHVAGYAAFNDVSASQVIRADGNFDRGKNFPTFGPFGPFLATADEIADPQDLAVRFEMDGRVLQEGTTADMVFSVAALISILSHQTALMPGDVIASGTPAGVAPLQTPPTWLAPGATMTVTVKGLGTLTNPVVAEVPHG